MINKEQVLSILREAYPTLKQKYHLESMELFGSVSRGESTAKDVDIAITYDEEFTIFTLVNLLDELKEMLGVEVDIVCKNSLSTDFAHNIADDLIAV